jgi:hypothetical protein
MATQRRGAEPQRTAALIAERQALYAKAERKREAQDTWLEEIRTEQENGLKALGLPRDAWKECFISTTGDDEAEISIVRGGPLAAFIERDGVKPGTVEFENTQRAGLLSAVAYLAERARSTRRPEERFILGILFESYRTALDAPRVRSGIMAAFRNRRTDTDERGPLRDLVLTKMDEDLTRQRCRGSRRPSVRAAAVRVAKDRDVVRAGQGLGGFGESGIRKVYEKRRK